MTLVMLLIVVKPRAVVFTGLHLLGPVGCDSVYVTDIHVALENIQGKFERKKHCSQMFLCKMIILKNGRN